jgi:hypothetical protein
MKKYFIILVVLGFVSCKKDKTKDKDQPSNNGSSTVVYETNNLTDVIKIVSSFNGSHIVALRNYGTQYAYLHSSDGGETWKTFSINRSTSKDFTVNNDGMFAWEDGSNGNIYNLNTNSFITTKPDGFYNEYYAVGNLLYCIQGTNSSIPPKVFIKQSSANQWDTLTKEGDSLGIFCGEDKDGGIAFYNRQTKFLYIHKPGLNKIQKHKVDVDFSTITQGQSNRQMSIVFNGYNALCFAYTAGFGVANVTNNTIQYQVWPDGFKGNYQNPLNIDIDNDGAVYANLISIGTQQFKYQQAERTTMKTNVPVFCNGEYTYIIDYLNPVKKGPQTKSLDGLLKAETEIVFSGISNQTFYVILKSDDINNISFLQIFDKSKSEKVNHIINGNVKSVFHIDNQLLICRNDSIGLSENNGESFTYYLNPSNLPFTDLKKINGTYYALAAVNFNKTLGGTGFTVNKHSMAMLTSTDLKTWTILNGTQRTEASGDKPGTFTTNGVMTLVDNINPLGNMVLVYTMSDDFGVTWKDNPAKMIFNTELPNGSLAQISYAGPSEIKRTNYSSTLQRVNDFGYVNTYKNLPIAVQSPIVSNNKIYFVTSKDILELSL